MIYPITHSHAVISNDLRHRYSLIRKWDMAKPMIMFIGLNPSRADQVNNDATIIRCINYAQHWTYDEVSFTELMEHGEGYKKYGGMYFANLYSFRTPYVNNLPASPAHDQEIEKWQPLTHNLHIAHNETTDQHLKQMIADSKTVVCCWGAWKFTQTRAQAVLAMIDKPMCFGTNADGSPKHPLYLAKTTQLMEYDVSHR